MNLFRKCVFRFVSWNPYSANRTAIDNVLGSSFAAFYRALDRSNFYREPERTTLHIHAGMAEGCTVGQLNDVVKSMENYLAGFDEIKVFTTTVASYSNASIVVEFHPEYEKTFFPSYLKSVVTAMAMNFGGANWSVYGVDMNYFSNKIISSHKSSGIILKGYNYQELLGYAEYLADYLSQHRRVVEPEIWGAGMNGRPITEFGMSYDRERLAMAGQTPHGYYSALSSRLYDETVSSINKDGEITDVVLQASDAGSFDLWHVLNSPSLYGVSALPMREIGHIDKYLSGLDITKSLQSYEISVCFDFIGSYELSKNAIENAVEHMNREVLPIGYKAENPLNGWFGYHKDRYAWLIFLIIAIIFVMLSFAFESLRQPLAVIFMIPVSFIGLFLTFGLSSWPFDQGGFAAFVMLCGIVVNAGVYIIFTYNQLDNPEGSAEHRVRMYVKAFNRKITPVMLTIVSTILGLIPFLADGPMEVFWFDFAAGTIGGMLFSVIALVLVLPVFAIPCRGVGEG